MIFFISKIRFLDIKNHFLISRNRIFDIRKSFSDIKKELGIFYIKKLIFWSQIVKFLKSKNNLFFWYEELDFLILEYNLLISKIRILDIRKWNFDIKKWFVFSDIRNRFFLYQKIRPIYNTTIDLLWCNPQLKLRMKKVTRTWIF